MLERYSRWLILVLSLSLAPTLSAQAQITNLPTNGGLSNQQRTAGELLSGPLRPMQGRTAVIAWHKGYVITVPEAPSSLPNSDLHIRVWDISDPTNPVVIAGDNGELGNGSSGFNAHGFIKTGRVLATGGWTQRFIINGTTMTQGNMFNSTNFPGGVTELDHVSFYGSRGLGFYSPWGASQWWSYGTVSGMAELRKGNQILATWDHLGQTGVIGFPIIVGNLLFYVSDQSRTGVASYDISDPTNPVLLDVLKDGDIGGYWPGIWSHYIICSRRNNDRGFQMIDISDPSNLRLTADIRVPEGDLMYPHFQDEYLFTERYKFDLRNQQQVLTLDENGTQGQNNTGSVIDGSQFALIVGNLWLTGGLGNGQGMAIWAHQSAPDTRGPFVSWHVPGPDQTNYPISAPISVLIHETLESETIVNGTTVVVRPVGGQPIDCRLTFSMDDVLTITPNSDLAPNMTYEVVFPAGGIRDAANNGMEGYSFRFSTGSTVNGGNLRPTIQDLTTSVLAPDINDQVTFTSQATDPNGDPLEYRFDFGDGSQPTSWSSQASINHTFTRTGHFRVQVQVRDNSQAISSSSFVITVAPSITGQRPSKSSQLCLDENRRRVWTVNPDNNSVTVVDADTDQRVFELATSADPRSVAIDNLGRIWVACFDADMIDIFDGGNGQRIQQIDLGYGSGPIAIAPSPSGLNLYVTLTNRGQLKRFEASSMSEVDSLDLDRSARAIAIKSDESQILVTRFHANETRGLVWSVRFNNGSMAIDKTIELVRDPGPILSSGSQFSADLGDTDFAGRGVPNYLASIEISPDDSEAWVVAKKDNTERGRFNDSHDQNQVNTLRAIVCHIDLTTDSEDFRTRKDVDNSDSPAALAFSDRADYGFVALQGNNAVVIYDSLLELNSQGNNGLRIVARLPTDNAPQGLLFDSVTNKLFVKAFLSRTLQIFNLQEFIERGVVNAQAQTVQTVTQESLAANVLNGKRIFYDASSTRMGSQGYVSCASCHLDGGSDDRVWDFTDRGEGLRNTTSLRGRRGVGHGRVHWSGNFDEIHDFEHDIRGPFGGTGFLSNADFQATNTSLGAAKAGLSQDLDDLSAYVTSLDYSSVPKSPFRNSDGTMTTAAVAGRMIFEQQNCNSCHAGDDLTDSTSNALHNVGTIRTSSGNRLSQTLTGIDTPTLHGIWNNAPYLHDGSAKTLDEVFSEVGGVVIQAETGNLLNGAGIRTGPHLDFNSGLKAFAQGDSRVGSYGVGWGIQFNNIEGGSGGLGRLRVRHLGTYGRTMTVTVNGQSQSMLAPGHGRTNNVDNPPIWLNSSFDINLNPGTNNSITIEVSGSFDIDSIQVATSDNIAQTAAHSVVNTLPTTERDQLIAYLQQLDGRDATGQVIATNTPSPTPTPTTSSASGGGGGGGGGGCQAAKHNSEDQLSSWLVVLAIMSLLALRTRAARYC